MYNEWEFGMGCRIPIFLIYETDLCKKLIDVDSMAMFIDYAVGFG